VNDPSAQSERPPWIAAESGARFPVTNPATGETIVEGGTAARGRARRDSAPLARADRGVRRRGPPHGRHGSQDGKFLNGGQTCV